MSQRAGRHVRATGRGAQTDVGYRRDARLIQGNQARCCRSTDRRGPLVNRPRSHAKLHALNSSAGGQCGASGAQKVNGVSYRRSLVLLSVFEIPRGSTAIVIFTIHKSAEMGLSLAFRHTGAEYSEVSTILA